MTQVTQDDLLQALADALAQPTVGDAMTMHELREATGWGHDKVRGLLRRLQIAGRLDVVKVDRMGLAGVTKVLAYRIKK